MSPQKNMMQIVAVIERNANDPEKKKSYWNRIGVAFQNKDGSWNLRFDYLPANMAQTTIQLREMDKKEDEAAAAQ